MLYSKVGLNYWTVIICLTDTLFRDIQEKYASKIEHKQVYS